MNLAWAAVMKWVTALISPLAPLWKPWRKRLYEMRYAVMASMTFTHRQQRAVHGRQNGCALTCERGRPPLCKFTCVGGQHSVCAPCRKYSRSGVGEGRKRRRGEREKEPLIMQEHSASCQHARALTESRGFGVEAVAIHS